MNTRLGRPSRRALLGSAGAIALLIAAATTIPGCVRQYVYQRLTPFPMPTVQPVDGVGSLSASACGACHSEQYAEWQASMMAQAWTDPVFQHDFAHRGEPYYCRNCHTPLQNQQPSIVEGIEQLRPSLVAATRDNPSYDEGLRDEGVTCVVCHLVDGHIAGPHDVSSPPAPHPVAPDDGFSRAELCERCHQMPILPLTRLDRPLTDTHAEWREWKQQTGRTESCVDCHMPAVQRPLMPGMPAREGRRHTFPGGWDDDLVRSSVRLDGLNLDGRELSVQLSNLAGHRVPSAEPIRALELRVSALDATGTPMSAGHVIERIVEAPGNPISDNTLAPAESRTVTMVLPRPARSATVELLYHRLKNLEGDAPHGLDERATLRVAEVRTP